MVLSTGSIVIDSLDPVKAKSVPEPTCGAGVIDSCAVPSRSILTDPICPRLNSVVEDPSRLICPEATSLLIRLSVAVPDNLKRTVSSTGSTVMDSLEPVKVKSLPLPIYGTGVIESCKDTEV